MSGLPVDETQLNGFVAVQERLIDMGVVRVESRALEPTAPLLGQRVSLVGLLLPGCAAVDDIHMAIVLGLLDLAAEFLDGLEVLSGLLGILEVLFVPIGQAKGDDLGMIVARMIVAVTVIVLCGETTGGPQSTCQGNGCRSEESLDA